jgi:CubicO group peptidase (beta-lactamase class C family)
VASKRDFSVFVGHVNLKSSSDQDARTRRVEKGLPPFFMAGTEPPVELTLQKLMQLCGVPGLSIAVMDNFEIPWTKGYGVTEVGTSNPVTHHNLFQAGSVSKPVAPAGALHPVGLGKLQLDDGVDHALITWKGPDNEFAKEQ